MLYAGFHLKSVGKLQLVQNPGARMLAETCFMEDITLVLTVATGLQLQTFTISGAGDYL